MRRVYAFFLVLLLFFGIVCSLTYLLKQKNVSYLKADSTRITAYKNWGLETHEFEAMYASLVQETENTPLLLIPFQIKKLQAKHDNILRLTQAGYATEIANQKAALQSRLSYLRVRVKNANSLTQEKKQAYFDTFEVVAGQTFEITSDINGIKRGLLTLAEKDASISSDIEAVKKESLMSELSGYKTTCSDLYTYFEEKNSQENITIAATCINEADTLMGPQYRESGADYVATLVREHVFAAMQKALSAKQLLIQQEQYTAELKKKAEEKLTLVPPSPRQEGKLILVNLGLQRLYAYENGKSIFAQAIPITTGKYGFETVTGEFAIYLKEQQHKMVSPFPGIYYDDVVNYWMPFYLGYGLHDAPWRSVYGTQDYPVVGSHGCVNIPLNDTIVLYNWAEVGTKVIVI